MGKITIGKKEFNTEERILDQNELYFYFAWSISPNK
jgi:hypothetical protein